MMDKLLTLSTISVHRDLDDKKILDNVSFTLKQGEILTIIGPNGAGKTTLLKVILGLIQPTTGTLWIQKGTKLGYMPQKIEANPFLPIDVERLLHLSCKDSIQSAQIDDSLKRVHALSLKKQSIQTLSGGEWQRVLLARTILRKPQLLILDEPTQGVDVLGQEEFYHLLAQLRQELGCGIILVSHDLHFVMAAADNVICLNGHVCCSGHPEVVAIDPHYLKLFKSKRTVRPATPGLAPYAHHHDHRHDDCDHK
ncbi:MAG: ATP-binding cassette domain-containing protein [Alphaproteobacteria bacterium]|nr:ATP-binding cassette domain-containing protein [Alphaproteobacteria bacterium]